MKTLSCFGVALVVVAACGGEAGGSDDGAHEGSDAGAHESRDGATREPGDGGMHGSDDAAAKDAGPPPVCTIPAYLTGDAGRAGGCYANRALIECDNVNGGCTTIALSPYLTSYADAGGGNAFECGSSSGPDTMPETCSDQCTPGEYAVECDIPEDGGDAPSPPAGCRDIEPAAESAESTYSCCPCGS